MGQDLAKPFTEEEVKRFDAVATKVRSLLENYKDPYFIKYERGYLIEKPRGGDETITVCHAIGVHVPEEKQDEVSKFLPEIIDDMEIHVDWIDPMRQADGFYDITHYNPKVTTTTTTKPRADTPVPQGISRVPHIPGTPQHLRRSSRLSTNSPPPAPMRSRKQRRVVSDNEEDE